MKYAVIGSNGRVGKCLVKLGCLPISVDVTDFKSVDNVLTEVHPDIVVNLASISNVDYCEDKAHQDEVISVNYRGTLNVAKVAQQLKIGMVQLSTDHIFNGKRGPYKEDYRYYAPNIFGQVEKPVNFYGLSKIAAEGLQRVYPNMKIVRTSYLFDKDRMGESKVYYPTFLYRSFMHVEHFAQVLYEYLKKYYEMPNILHISGSRTISWYNFAKEYYLGQEILPRKKDVRERGTVLDCGVILDSLVAPRPYRSGLDTTLSARLGLPQFSYVNGICEGDKEDGSN